MEQVDRRQFMQKAGIAGATAGALWVAPSVLGSSTACAVGSCVHTALASSTRHVHGHDHVEHVRGDRLHHHAHHGRLAHHATSQARTDHARHRQTSASGTGSGGSSNTGGVNQPSRTRPRPHPAGLQRRHDVLRAEHGPTVRRRCRGYTVKFDFWPMPPTGTVSHRASIQPGGRADRRRHRQHQREQDPGQRLARQPPATRPRRWPRWRGAGTALSPWTGNGTAARPDLPPAP